MHLLLCIPTLNASRELPALFAALARQTIRPDALLVIDSGSTDDTVTIASRAGARIRVIAHHEFNHGATRQLAVALVPEADIVVFMTQDAAPAADDSLERLTACFIDETVGAAYGRQLPRPGAGPIEAHARLFNYPRESEVKSMADAPRLGLKSAFISNSFAAWRRTALMAVGGFPTNTIFGEDTCTAARMLIAGWKIAYCAEAAAYHSHGYGYRQEFRRYFDIGVLHAREPWIRRSLGQAGVEGQRFVLSELRYLMRENPLLIPSALVRTVLKLLGFKTGLREERVPAWVKKRLSMHRGYWK
jgi:GT2 family glycosyltransferase